MPLLIGLLVAHRRRAHHGVRQHQGMGRAVARALERAGFRVGVLSGDVPQKKRETPARAVPERPSWRSWSPPTSPRAACTSTASATSSTSTCRSTPKTTCTASAVPRVWAPRATRSASPANVYAQGLPDIEAFIEQKIPVEPVTRELLIALPRPERAPIAADDEDTGESVSQIFREARAEAEASGRGRSGSRSGPGGASSGPRSRTAARRDDAPRRERKPATPAPHREPAAVAPAAPVPVAAVAATDPAAAPRKRRRRPRGGRGGADATATGTPGSNGNASSNRNERAAGGGGKQPVETAPVGLLKRIASGLRRLVKRPPSRSH